MGKSNIEKDKKAGIFSFHLNKCIGLNMPKRRFLNYLFPFLTLFLSLIISDRLYAAASASSCAETDTFFTPGKKVSTRTGKQLLDMKETLVEIFGEGEYDVLFEEPLRTEDPGFRSALSRLSNNLKIRFRKNEGDPEKLKEIIFEIDMLRDEIKGIPEDRLEHYAEAYFKRMAGFEGVKFRAKPDGDQLGAKAVVIFSGKPATFYIKTHALGHRSLSRSSGAKQLDPVELMVYAVLEQLGEAPEVHFFGRDPKTAFIATAEAGEEGTPFAPYESYSKDPTKQKILWGSEAYDYIKTTPYAEREVGVVMGLVDGNPQSRTLADLFSRLDIISRIFRLTDLIGNKGNFGFSLDSEGTIRKHSIVDFRVMPDERGSYYIREGNLYGFYKGNSMFNYLSADSFVCHVLRDRPAEIRASIALPHAQNIEALLAKASDRAIEKVMGFIESISENAEEPDRFISESQGKIEEYRAALFHNVRMYVKYFEAGAPEVS